MEADRALEVAGRAARAGGEVALESFRGALDVRSKAGTLDPVTRADLDAQRRVVEVVGEASDHPVVAEEADQPKAVPESGTAWIVDPIDGTNNYARGNRLWATSVAFVREGEPVAGVTRLPAVGDVYAAGAGGASRNDDPATVSGRTEPGTLTVAPLFGLGPEDRDAYARAAGTVLREFGDLRRLGSGQTTLAMVAAGELDAAVSTVALAPWDTVAGVHLVRAAGGTVTTPDGDPWRHDSAGLVATNGGAHDAVLDVVGTA